ncbi:hypothetical protein PYW07_004061 [Mythimna separata]|uniref:15-hydroxyprostaglandin dehydrogenase [NAD(+)] n=1 Tax=Mythimna separata TaxID=271217 RepID=A0AAD8DUQ2_MYTSE|nr:hypothetical protein PYW07_004061 [Mythimna separata]
MYDLTDKVVLVTGASQGIGANFVRQVLEEGVQHVRILDIDVNSGVLLQDELNKKYGNEKVKFVKCDVTNDEQFFKALENAKEEKGYIDLLVNNAGVADESKLSAIRKLIEINYIALVNGTLKAIELMGKDNGGRGGTVINISSVAGLIQVSPMFTYSSAKRAVMQFSHCIGRLHSLSHKVHLTNIRGLHSNIVAVHHHLETEKPALLFLSETQIRCPSDVSYLLYPGFTLEHNFKPRAGVCMCARDDICYRRLRNLEDSRFSTLWALVDTGLDKIIYACVYRSHSGDQETTGLTQHLSEAAEAAQQRYPSAQLVLLGDFNAHHQEWLFPFQCTDHAGREMRKLALTLNLTQLVQGATRVPDVDSHTPNCLDLLLTTDPDRYSVSISAPLGSSDHCLVKSVSVYSPPDPSPRGTRRMWRYRSADWDGMRSFFACYPWQPTCFSSEDASSCADAVTDVLRQGMEYYIPFSDVSVSGGALPWFSAECGRANALKRAAYRAWVDSRTRNSLDVSEKKKAFNRAAKSCKKVMQRARFDHISRIGNKLASYPAGSKAFWSLAKSVESNFCRPSLPPLLRPDGSLAHTAEEKANLFASGMLAESSRLDSGDASPPAAPDGGETSMSDIRIHQKDVRRLDPCSDTGVRVMSICFGVTDTAILAKIKCIEKRLDLEVQKVLNAHPMQSAESAARGIIDMFKKGESASIWLIRANEPAEDITAHILKADADIAQVIAGSSK